MAHIVCLGRQAEVAGQYLTKGKQVLSKVESSTRSWDDRQSGEKRYKTEIICENFQMLSSRGDSGGGGYRAPASADDGADFSAPPDDDDIPF